MCQIIVVPAGKEINMSALDKAQEHNQDGYGVAWYEDKVVKTYKTMNYSTFKGILNSLAPYTKIVHLRYTTVGENSLDNCHPFDINNGVMFHNGTINSLSPSFKDRDKGESDSYKLAELINKAYYDEVQDIEPFLQHIIGDTINKLAFLEQDGTVTILNEHLGMEDDGIWYSNDYHKKPEGWCRAGCKPKVKVVTKKPTKQVVEQKEKLTTVFVYGTLKRGYSNHSYNLGSSTFLGKAKTSDNWVMIGEGHSFPYVTHKDDAYGGNVKGEVYEVNKQTLDKLDRLEGVAYNHYKKVATKVEFDDKTEMVVNMYVACRVPQWAEGSNIIEEWVR